MHKFLLLRMTDIWKSVAGTCPQPLSEKFGSAPKANQPLFGAYLLTSLLASQIAWGGVKYLEPTTGWRYTYDGTFDPVDGILDGGCVDGRCPPGFGNPSDAMALDGTWMHDQGDKWDGTAPGDPLSDPTGSIDDPDSGPAGTAPGGAGAFVEGNTTFLGIQDTGNPEHHGWCQGGMGLCDVDGHPAHMEPTNNNRRVYFGHDMTQDGPLESELVMSVTGITISARVRIPTDPSRLDDIYPEGPDVIPWFQDAPHGRGMPMLHSRGMINVVQNNPGASVPDEDTSVGFSVVTSDDVDTFCSFESGALCNGSGSGGLIMNNLSGNAPTEVIDSTGFGELNMLEIPDEELNDWNEFWITMENNAGAPGNIRVNVYRNGSIEADSFDVTLASRRNAVYSDSQSPFLEFGLSANSSFGSLDVDFISYAIGVLAPVPRTDNADFDDSGLVAGKDFLIWQQNYSISSGANRSIGDANGDESVDADDLRVWEAQVGNAPPSTTENVVSTPEPQAWTLMLLFNVSVLAAARRRYVDEIVDCRRL